MLKVQNVTVRYGEHAIVDDISLSLREGQWLMLVGPNGAGKSTLLEAISGGAPYSGRILWDGKNIRSLKPSHLAQKIGVLAQKNSVGYAYSVEEVVGLGRYAHATGLFASKDTGGQEHVERALALAGLTQLRHANVLTLSGGELQRTFLAQVFAQDPQLLILDEPANHLDLVYQKHIFGLIGEWLIQPGRAVLSVVHDLSLARRYGTDALLMHKGKCAAQGEISTVLSPELLEEVYAMDVYGWMRDLLGQWN